MEGVNIYKTTLPQEVSWSWAMKRMAFQKLEALIKNKLSIPRFGKSKTESLNVAAATAIVLSEFRR
jgi:TrmH family RNA methyltransferase